MPGLEHATITDTISGERVSVLFNPEEYTVDRDTTFAQLPVPGLSAPVVQFLHGNAQTLEMELLVDTYEASSQAPASSDVRELTQKVVKLMDIAPSLHAPPPVIFAWGSLTFTCVLQRCVQRFILFRPDGVPVRARLQVTFSEFRNAELEPHLGRVARDRAHRMSSPVSGSRNGRRGIASVWPVATARGSSSRLRTAIGRHSCASP